MYTSIVPIRTLNIPRSISFNSLKPNGYFMYHQLWHSQIQRFFHEVHFYIFLNLWTNSDYFHIVS